MSSTFESINKGLEEAVAFSQGKPVEAKTYHPQPVDVKSVRSQSKLTQNEFAATFGISVSTLRHSERGDRKPQGPALLLLNLVRKSPDTVLSVSMFREVPGHPIVKKANTIFS
jgi:putative transcriptional regulator